MATTSQQKRGCGCFSYGCVIALTIIIVVGGGVAYYLYHQVRSAVWEYTSESAPGIVPVPVAPEIAQSAEQKISLIKGALDGGTSVQVEFSSDEVSAAIQQTPWRDKIALTLDGDSLRGQFSFPISAVGEWPAARILLGDAVSRVVAGSFAGKLRVEDGKASISFSELTLNGHTLEDMAQGHASQWITGAVNAPDIDDQGQPHEDERLRQIRRCEVKDGRLFISVGPRV